jgi:hypothetical protein
VLSTSFDPRAWTRVAWIAVSVLFVLLLLASTILGAAVGLGVVAVPCLMMLPFATEISRRVVWRSMRRLEQRFAQRNRDRAAKLVALEVTLPRKLQRTPFCLYLRPFSSTGRLPVVTASLTTQFRTPVIGRDYRTTTANEITDLETLLARALVFALPLVALGRPGEQVGAGRIRTTEEDWWTRFLLLARNAAAIIVLPSRNAGTKRELETIFAKPELLSKTAFIIPPGPDRTGAAEVLEEVCGKALPDEPQSNRFGRVIESNGRWIEFTPEGSCVSEPLRSGKASTLSFWDPLSDAKGTPLNQRAIGKFVARTVGIAGLAVWANVVRDLAPTPRDQMLARQRRLSWIVAGLQLAGLVLYTGYLYVQWRTERRAFWTAAAAAYPERLLSEASLKDVRFQSSLSESVLSGTIDPGTRGWWEEHEASPSEYRVTCATILKGQATEKIVALVPASRLASAEFACRWPVSLQTLFAGPLPALGLPGISPPKTQATATFAALIHGTWRQGDCQQVELSSGDPPLAAIPRLTAPWPRDSDR